MKPGQSYVMFCNITGIHSYVCLHDTFTKNTYHGLIHFSSTHSIKHIIADLCGSTNPSWYILALGEDPDAMHVLNPVIIM